jgi:hypothetical protein
MTNGEKIQTILDVDRDCTEVHGDNGTMTFTVTLDFWNAEYKEPSSSGKPNKSIEEKCPCYYCEHFEIKGLSHCKIHEDTYGDSRCNDYHKINQKPNKSEIPTGSTTKNDLGVDCIDKAELLKAMDTWDKFGYTARYGLERLDKDDKDFVPYVKYDDMVNCVKNMPPATPIRPKGHWIARKKVGFGKWKDVTVLVNLKGCVTDSCECSKCGDWLTGSDEYECSARYCPNCGAEMESEVRE